MTSSRSSVSPLFRLWVGVLLLSAVLSSVSAQNCVLTVPADPLSAIGLSTPYIVTGCTQQPLPNGMATFVQATIVDLDTGNLFAYTPLVLAAAAPNNVAQINPVLPVLPRNYTVGLWFGTNGGSTTLAATITTNAALNTPQDSLVQGNCVNGGGEPYSIFGQFAACNARQFFDAVYALVNKGLITVANTPNLRANQVPALGVDVNNDPCPTTHSFSIVDQDQSDNTDGKYLIVTATGNLAVSTVANKATLTANHIPFTEIDNGSDELLVTLVQSAIGCTPYQVRDLGDPTGQTFTSSLATNEIQAMLSMNVEPRAFLPANDPMALNTVTNQPDVRKLNAYRTAVGQSTLTTVADASTRIYCNNMYAVGAPAIAKWLPRLANVAAPDFGTGISNSLGGLLVGRFGAAVNPPNQGGMLNCPGLLNNLPNPFANFAPAVGATARLQCPPPLIMDTCVMPATATQTLATVLGVQNLAPDLTGQFTVDVPAGLTINAQGGIAGTVAPGTTTTTTTTNNTFSATSFAAGIGTMAGIVLLCGLAFYFMVWRKNAQNNVSTSNMSMNRY